MGLLQRYRNWRKPPPPVVPPLPPPVIVSPSVYAEIKALKEQADWMGRLLEDEERNFTYGEDGTVQFGQHAQAGPTSEQFGYWYAYNQCFNRPGYTACFFINEAQHRIIRARSRAFTSINPYWHGIQHNVKTHVVGTGHTWTVMPRNPAVTVPPETIAKVQKEIDDFYNNGYRELQKEKLDRKSRDGEYFLQYQERDKKLTVRFVEPLLVWNPAGKSANDGVWFGIQFLRGDYETPVGYYVRRTDWLGGDKGDGTSAWDRMIPADLIQHRKVNVDKSGMRGVPDTYWVQSRLEQSLRTLKAMGTLVQVRAKIAMIRKRINALAGTVQPMLSSQAAATISGPGAQIRNVFQYPEGAILDTSDQAEYQFPGQNIETDKIISSVQADLQAVASAMGIADYMVSGSLGGSSYATAMVAEGPVVKTFACHQQDMIDEDREVVTRVIQTAIDNGRLDADTLDLMMIEMHGPALARMGIQESQSNALQQKASVKSSTTWQQENGLNPTRERANQLEEAQHRLKMAETEAKIQAIMAPPAATGDGGGDSKASGGARERATSNARPFSPDQEGRQIQRASGATKEEDEAALAEFQRKADAGEATMTDFAALAGRLFESSYEPHPQDEPTQAELDMARVFLTDTWLTTTKNEILSLPMSDKSPRESGLRAEYEPGVAGVYLGIVDAQEVWAIDADAIMIRHDFMDFVVAGNSARYDWIPTNKVLVDWSYMPLDAAHDLLHELCEERCMTLGKWSYSLAHKIANHFERIWLLELRPELAALKPKE